MVFQRFETSVYPVRAHWGLRSRRPLDCGLPSAVPFFEAAFQHLARPVNLGGCTSKLSPADLSRAVENDERIMRTLRRKGDAPGGRLCRLPQSPRPHTVQGQPVQEGIVPTIGVEVSPPGGAEGPGTPKPLANDARIDEIHVKQTVRGLAGWLRTRHILRVETVPSDWRSRTTKSIPPRHAATSPCSIRSDEPPAVVRLAWS